MHSLETLHVLNARAARRSAQQAAETETSRHCSFVHNSRGLVLHSAKRRGIVFLEGVEAAKFLRLAAKNRRPEKRDVLIESYFTT